MHVTIAIIQPSYPAQLWIALTIMIVAIVIAAVRRTALPATSKLLIALGMIALALACGGPVYRGHDRPMIAVMVDVSPSARGAGYVDRVKLRHRTKELLGTKSFRLYAFADTSQEVDPSQPPLERPAERTNFSPPRVDAVVLFSDARFDLPATARRHSLWSIRCSSARPMQR
jgi:hypothetical protein